MSALREAAQQALEALKFSTPNPRSIDDDYAEQGWKEHIAAVAALRAALAQQAEPVEPVATLTAQRDALLEALKGMLHRDERNTCRHEETHHGGAIWEICDSCGAMWADDEGGKPEWEDPKEWTQARAAIKAVKEGK